MRKALISPEIEELIVAREFATVREVVVDWDAPSIAEIVEDLSPDSCAILLGVLPKKLASETFAYCDSIRQHELLRSLATEQVAAMLNEMAADDRRELFQGLPANVVAELVNQLSVEERAVAIRLLNYPEDSVGRLMTPDYVQVKKHWAVQEALEHIRQFAKDSEKLTSLIGAVLWATLTGSMLPILLKRLGCDSATSSAPFVATLVDVTGIIIYFSVASLFLHGMLL